MSIPAIASADLPEVVRRALDELGGLPARYVVDVFRIEAHHRTRAAARAERDEQWPEAAELHKIAVGFIVAAERIESGYGSLART